MTAACTHARRSCQLERAQLATTKSLVGACGYDDTKASPKILLAYVVVSVTANLKRNASLDRVRASPLRTFNSGIPPLL